MARALSRRVDGTTKDSNLKYNTLDSDVGTIEDRVAALESASGSYATEGYVDTAVGALDTRVTALETASTTWATKTYVDDAIAAVTAKLPKAATVTGITSDGSIGITIPASSWVIACYGRNTSATAQPAGWNLRFGSTSSSEYLTDTVSDEWSSMGAGNFFIMPTPTDVANSYLFTDTEKTVYVSSVLTGASLDFTVLYITP